DFGGNAAMQWRSILVEARAEERLPQLLAIVRQSRPPLGVRIDELIVPRPTLEPDTGPSDKLSDPDGDAWHGFGAERLISGDLSTLLGISFLSVGVQRSHSVCRLTAAFGPKRVHGTASLIGPGLLLTNHHVLHDWDGKDRAATAAEAWFDYELDEEAQTRQLTVVPCDITTIAGDRGHDWAVIRTAAAPPPTSVPLRLRGAPVPRPDDYVFIIQHP